MKYSLWIDDVKNPSISSFARRYISPNEFIIWARDLEQAVFYVKQYGMPVKMYLDHDLARETTMDFLKWLVNMKYGLDFEYEIISANPEGSRNIVSFIDSWKKSHGDFIA